MYVCVCGKIWQAKERRGGGRKWLRAPLFQEEVDQAAPEITHTKVESHSTKVGQSSQWSRDFCGASDCFYSRNSLASLRLLLKESGVGKGADKREEQNRESKNKQKKVFSMPLK